MSGIHTLKMTVEIECVPPFDTRGKHQFDLDSNSAYCIAQMTPTQLKELQALCENFVRLGGRWGPDDWEFTIPKRKP